MTAAEWAVLVPAVVALAGAAAAWLRAQSAHTRISGQQSQITGLKVVQDAQVATQPPTTPPQTPPTAP